MVTAILATGDEIVHGDTLNTNAHVLAKALSSEGLPLGLHMTCSDKEPDLVECINFLAKKHEIVFILGGLGPTSDDRTRFALARYLNEELVEQPEAMNHISARLKRAGLPVDPGNRQQSLFPANTKLLPNPHGTAMGCIYKAQDKLFILLPGPPRECMPMFNDYVLPFLQKKSHSQKKLLSWRLFGAPEGEVAQALDGALAKVECHTGYRLEQPYLEFKVRCLPAQVAEVKQIIDPIVEKYIISPADQKASEKLRELIDKLDEPIVIIDDITGGLLQTLLQRPGNTHKVMFHKVKDIKLHFYLSGLDAYWFNTKDSNTELVIEYDNQQKSVQEAHKIPYRGNELVLGYAAEWLSFRLFHLINQIHYCKA